jgi:hypothetical protein
MCVFNRVLARLSIKRDPADQAAKHSEQHEQNTALSQSELFDVL